MMWVKPCHFYHPWLGMVSLYHLYIYGDDCGMVNMTLFYPQKNHYKPPKRGVYSPYVRHINQHKPYDCPITIMSHEEWG